MKSFLLKGGTPLVKWSMIPDEVYFEGKKPEGYDLAVAPSDNYVILDVDVKNDKNGYNHIPPEVKNELDKSFHYDTKSGGRHYWLNYTGNKLLMNRATQFGLDLRVAEGKYAKGYVKYPYDKDIRECISLINNTTSAINNFLDSLFS